MQVQWPMAYAVWMRNVTEYKHTWKMNLLPNFFEPVLYLVGMGLGLGYYVSEGMENTSYVAFIAPGLTAAAAMNGASFETTYNMFVKMSFSRLYEAFLTTPAQTEDIMVGELMWAVTRALLYGAAFWLILGLLTALGHPLLTEPTALLIPVALVVIGVLFGLIGQLFTSLIRQIDLYSYYYTLFLTPLFLFSGIFFPVNRFPYGESVAWFTPLYHSVRLCRGLAQGPLDGKVLTSTLWLLLAIAALTLIVPGRMRRRLMT